MRWSWVKASHMNLAQAKGLLKEDLASTKMKTGMMSSMELSSAWPDEASNAQVFISNCATSNASTTSLGVEALPELKSASIWDKAAAALEYGPAEDEQLPAQEALAASPAKLCCSRLRVPACSASSVSAAVLVVRCEAHVFGDDLSIPTACENVSTPQKMSGTPNEASRSKELKLLRRLAFCEYCASSAECRLS
mmetsp:Transcript_71023/g.154379  ORF Transcript_71023/g.154379 Transcript_71023/m.154379 type:complete len:194 (-) Transcript_71023:784-1365(-)